MASGTIPGCTCPIPGCTCAPDPKPTPGMSGFSEAGEEDFAAGTVTGYRWWTLTAPDLTRNPLDAEQDWRPRLLRGQRAEWQPGVNEAACLAGLAGPRAHEDPLPSAGCGCGFWAYWSLAQHNMARPGELLVAGVIEGWGRTRIGERGFRCATARILALCLPFTITPEITAPGPSTADILRRHLPASRVTGPGEPCSAPVPCTDRAALDWAQAWMAVIEDRLAETYPGVTVFSDQAAMLAKFPLTRGYGA